MRRTLPSSERVLNVYLPHTLCELSATVDCGNNANCSQELKSLEDKAQAANPTKRAGSWTLGRTCDGDVGKPASTTLSPPNQRAAKLSSQELGNPQRRNSAPMSIPGRGTIYCA
eukprot:829373-Amphidinium_carterae.1